METTACYPGSIGEIIQGRYKDMDVLVSCPVNIYTKVRVFESHKPENKYKNYKTAQFLNSILNKWGHEVEEKNLDIDILSNIPRGKGFASSTADLCALYYALLKLFNKPFNQVELVEQCIKIEPTDSIVFKELTLFDYKTGSFAKALGPYPEFHALVFEGANTVDTVEFNKKHNMPMENIEDLTQLLLEGVREKEIKKIVSAAQESIIRNQPKLRYELLEETINISKSTGGLGVMGAHSGDCLAVIYDEKEKAVKAKKNIASNKINNYNNRSVYVLSTVGRWL